MFVETDDEAAGPDEDQERQEDGDEDGVADAGHGDLEHAMQLVSGQGRGGSAGLVVPRCLITTNVARAQLTAHTQQSRSEAHSLDFPLCFGFGARFENSLEHCLEAKISTPRKQGE